MISTSLHKETEILEVMPAIVMVFVLVDVVVYTKKIVGVGWLCIMSEISFRGHNLRYMCMFSVYNILFQNFQQNEFN